MNEYIEEKVELLERMRRIKPSAREFTVTFDSIDSHEAFPEELAGTIVDGLKDSEAVMLVPSGREPSELAELYIANRVTHRGQRLRYRLTDLQREAPGRFPFRAVRDFDPAFRVEPK